MSFTSNGPYWSLCQADSGSRTLCLCYDTPAAKLYAYIQALSPAVALPLLLTTAASLMDSPVAIPDVTVSFENSVSFPYIAMI